MTYHISGAELKKIKIHFKYFSNRFLIKIKKLTINMHYTCYYAYMNAYF